MDDAHDPYEATIEAMRNIIHVEIIETKSNGHRNQVTPLDIEETMRSIRVELQSCKVDNESIIRCHKENNQLNTSMLEIFTNIQRNIHHGKNSGNDDNNGSISSIHFHKRSHSSRIFYRDRTYTTKVYGSELSTSKDSTNNPIYSSHKNKRKRYFRTNHKENFGRPKPLTFDGEVKSRQ